MAKLLKQGIVQTDYYGTPNRIVVQYTSDVDLNNQQIINYVDLTLEEKAIYDSFKALCESKMI